MIKILKGLVLLILLNVSPVKADDTFTWMSTNLPELKNLFGCLEIPEFTSFKTGKTSLDIANSGVWQSTGNNVEKGKSIKFSWVTTGITPQPRKYLVLYRIDPRFDKPQIFIKTYNYQTKQYEAGDFPAFTSNPEDKDLGAIAFPKMQDYINYINFAGGRKKIRVEIGDVINLKFISPSSFFSAATKNNVLTQELGLNNILAASALYTNPTISGGDNRILYGTADKICNILDPTRNNSFCEGSGVNTRYIGNNSMTLVGQAFTSSGAKSLMDQITVCSYPINNNSAACYYQYGTDMAIKINSQIVKPAGTPLIEISGYMFPFLYYKSTIGGDLDFTTDLPISGMFDQSSKMSDWLQFSDFNSFSTYINSVKWGAKFIHFGSYQFQIEIGNGDNTVSNVDLNNIKVEYLIAPSGTTPDSSTSGRAIDQDFSTDAYQDGYLWLRVTNTNSYLPQGSIIVDYANYTGTTWFSDIIYNGAVKPITDQFKTFTENFYRKLLKNSAIQNIAKASLTLYVVIFGLMFVMGALKLTAQEVVTRIFKITIVAFLLQPESWDFFNKYLFSAFINGIDYFFRNVVGASSSQANVFGFIDPIFDKYTNGRVWGLLFIQLLQIQNGLAFIAIMTIYALILYFRAILEVIIGYIIAFIGMSVMISLAPFFIILMLFEKTKSLFDNWLSTLLSYVMQPTMLLIFFLLVDQILSEQLLKVVVRACWGTLIPIEIGFNLNHLGIPLSYSFTLPFLPGIPFFIPEVPTLTSANLLVHDTNTFLVLFTTALLFFSYCLMSYGLVNYVSIVVQQLTNVTPARIEGNNQPVSNSTESIMKDISSVAKPIGNAALAPARIFKDKVIDQNYQASKPDNKGKEYTNKLFSSRNDVKDGKEGEK